MSHQDFEAGYEAGRSEGWEEGFAAKNLDNIPVCDEKPESDLCREHTCRTCEYKKESMFLEPCHDCSVLWKMTDNWTPRKEV